MTSSVRVFVAATPAEWLPQRVLEFSIRETTSRDVVLQALYTFRREYAMPKAVRNRPRTPFSFQRFLIPEICGHEGRAIYMDADMQVFKDIEALWSVPMHSASLQTVAPASDGRKGQFSVMLLDCEALRWSIDEIVQQLDQGWMSYEQLMYEMCVAPSIGRDIPSTWNMLERHDSSTALLHYTDMNTQPWVSTANPLGHLWVACLRRAVDSGFISRDELQRETASGHVRPSLLAQLDLGINDPRQLGKAARKADRFFVAPYKRLQSKKARPWTSPWGMGAALSHAAWGRFKWLMRDLTQRERP